MNHKTVEKPDLDFFTNAQTAFNKLDATAMKQTTVAERKRLLKKLKGNIWANKENIEKALFADYHRSDVETNLADTLIVLKEINHTLRHIADWNRPKRVSTPLILAGSSSYIQPEPKGKVLIISPWNFPFNLSFVPLLSAIAAGNAAIIKPSEFTPQSSQLIKKLVEETFEPWQVQVVDGDLEASKALLSLPFNHIFFTGSPAVGKIVMASAAQHLASVTLELGGKSPVIVHEDANLNQAAEIVAWSKFINNGQVCIAGDYVLVHSRVKDVFLKKLREHIEKFFIQGDARQNDAYSRIVNQKQYSRLMQMIEEATTSGAQALTPMAHQADEKFISPLALVDVPEDAALMQQEIFGPVLPIRSYQTLDEAIEFINQKEKPLALYAFTSSERTREHILRNTSAGATVFNHVYLHHYNSELPFGGINNSGIGKSHGYFGFQEFSHMRAVVRYWSPINMFKVIFPPYTATTRKLVAFMMKYLG